MLLSTFFSADDVDNVSNIKANREPLLLALRARGLYHVSTLQMAVETINLLQRDSCDNTLYKYLRSIEVREPIDLIDLTEASKKVIISHINNYKIRELVTANLNLLLLNNIGINTSSLIPLTLAHSSHSLNPLTCCHRDQTIIGGESGYQRRQDKFQVFIA